MNTIIEYFPDLSAVQRKRFEQLLPLYADWNSKINVISRKDMDAFYSHHVLHSLGIAAFVNFTPGATVMDVGTGGGFPGIPLAIMFPEVQFTLVDSIAKKIKVVSEVTKALGLTNVKIFNQRVEQLPADMKFDFVVSRAVTGLPDFVKFVKGRFNKNGSNPMAVFNATGQPVKNGILYLKGGDLSAELAPYAAAELYSLKDKFDDPFFDSKGLVVLPQK